MKPAHLHEANDLSNQLRRLGTGGCNVEFVEYHGPEGSRSVIGSYNWRSAEAERITDEYRAKIIARLKEIGVEV